MNRTEYIITPARMPAGDKLVLFAVIKGDLEEVWNSRSPSVRWETLNENERELARKRIVETTELMIFNDISRDPGANPLTNVVLNLSNFLQEMQNKRSGKNE